MSRQDDDLDGLDDLSPRQQAAVARFAGRAGRYRRSPEPTNRDRWAAFQRAEDDNERRRFGRT